MCRKREDKRRKPGEFTSSASEESDHERNQRITTPRQIKVQKADDKGHTILSIALKLKEL